MTTPNEPDDGDKPRPKAGQAWHGGTPPPPQASRPAAGAAAVRPNRIVSGTAAPRSREEKESADASAGSTAAAPPAAKAGGKHDGEASDAYASELPDLSGPPRRSARATAAAEPKASPPARRAQPASRPRTPVRASMQIRRIDPWSTLKVSLILSVSLFFVWMIAVAFLYVVLGSMGVWSKLNSNVGDLLNNAGGGTELVSAGSIFGGAILIGLVNIVVLTAMATVGALIYNLTTDLIGGVEVTLADRD